MAEAWMSSPVLSSVITVIEVLGWVVAIGVWFFYKVRSEADKHERRLIDALQDRVNMLEAANQEYNKKLEKIVARNEVLEGLILKIGPEDREYKEQALKAMAQIETIYNHHVSEPKGK